MRRTRGVASTEAVERPTKRSRTSPSNSAVTTTSSAPKEKVVQSGPLSSFIVILRGVNVGSGNRIEMARLREALEASNFSDVRTLQAAGNLVLKSHHSNPDELRQSLKQVLESEFGLEVPVAVRSRDEIDAIVKANPFKSLSDADPKKLQVAFFQDNVSEEAKKGLELATVEPEKSFVKGREAYLWHAEGIARSKLWEAVGGKKGVPGFPTSRNWNTVLKLLEMSKEES